ncbi:YraN family protein [Knoellia sp. LjRoot47]|uniref:YraN family protein n=1 Tax=Knoellia sp. LjRoot47 TaxID=3342330 RepID=UPI003ED135A7
MDAHLALGRYGEELAARYLRDRGIRVLERNWRCPEGEIDIIALDGDCLVVCEVKTRGGTVTGDPVEAVTWEKVSRLRRLAAAYLRSRPGSVAHARVDVIGVLAVRGRPPVVRHVEAVGA